eukprot:TRINITY_DN3693_c0_g1_i1.p1 TRINITY_DN3693_c0_g1~~TRINITY_DN3693_c0_g1_i1.p1  ORF type:complete len:915 (+),score=208.24 TRINITY_DN3693_c0_g1_i1:126-2870(+)
MPTRQQVPRPVVVGGTRYEPQSVLGEGGFAVVYRALGPEGTAVALKRTRAPADGDPAGPHAAAVREARLLGALQRQQALCVAIGIDARVQSAQPGAVGEVIAVIQLYGESLAQCLRRHAAMERPLPESDAVSAAAACNVALGWLHRQSPPVAHRDVKPENLLRDESPSSWGWRLCDFGSASREAVKCTTRQQVAEIGELLDRTTTMAYRPPEMVDLWRGQVVGPKGDVWSLGVLLYVALAQQLPFGDEQPLAILNCRYALPDRPLAVATWQAVRGMLVGDPDQRPDAWGARRLLEAAARETMARLPPMPPDEPPADASEVSPEASSPGGAQSRTGGGGVTGKLAGMLDWSIGAGGWSERYKGVGEGSPRGGGPRDADELSGSGSGAGETPDLPFPVTDDEGRRAGSDIDSGGGGGGSFFDRDHAQLGDAGDSVSGSDGPDFEREAAAALSPPARRNVTVRRSRVAAVRDWLERQRVLPTRGLALIHRDTPHLWVLRSTGTSPRTPQAKYMQRYIANLLSDPDVTPFFHYLSLRPSQTDPVVCFKSVCAVHEVVLQGPPESVDMIALRHGDWLDNAQRTWSHRRGPQTGSLPGIIGLYCDYLKTRLRPRARLRAARAPAAPEDDEDASELVECFSQGAALAAELSPPHPAGEEYFDTGVAPLWTDLHQQRRCLALAARGGLSGKRWQLKQHQLGTALQRWRMFVDAVSRHPPLAAYARAAATDAASEDLDKYEKELQQRMQEAAAQPQAAAPPAPSATGLAAAFGPPQDFGVPAPPASIPPPPQPAAAAAPPQPAAAPQGDAALAAAFSQPPTDFGATPADPFSQPPADFGATAAPAPAPASGAVSPDDLFGGGGQPQQQQQQQMPQSRLNVDTLFGQAGQQGALPPWLQGGYGAGYYQHPGMLPAQQQAWQYMR